jgi:hypothetical protein
MDDGWLALLQLVLLIFVPVSLWQFVRGFMSDQEGPNYYDGN